MALNIPMPGQAIDTLLKGITTGSNMYTNIMNPILEREKQKQQQNQFMQSLALQKQTQDRANALLPYIEQGYQDIHGKAASEAQQRAFYQNLQQNALKAAGYAVPNDNSGTQTNLTDNVTTTAPVETPITGKLSDVQEDPIKKEQMVLQLQKIGMPRESAIEYLNKGGDISSKYEELGKTYNGEIATPEEARASLAQNLSMPPMGAQSQIPGISSQPQMLSQVPQQSQTAMPNNMMPGKEIVVKPATRGREYMDVLAGMPGSPFKLEKPEIRNGIIYQKYPSGRMTATVMPHFPGKESTLHGPARDASDLEKLKKETGENSEVYQNAKAAYDAQLDAKKDLRDLRARTKSGLKPGEKEFFDPKSGAPLGKEVSFTEKERQSEEGNILFNKLYPIVYKGASPFSGEGSITRLQKAAANYKTDPVARKLFDDFLLSNKMLAATTVNEAATLKARGTNNTYQMLKESLDAQDIPKIVSKLITQYDIPASAQLKAAMRYQKALSDARKEAHSTVPATKKLFYDPEQQAKYEQQDYTSEPSSGIKEVIVIDPTGKRFKTPEENAAHLPEGWQRG